MMVEDKEQPMEYARHADMLPKEEFIRMFRGNCRKEDWFTVKELEKFSGGKNVGSLAARFLIKKRICSELGVEGLENEIEILNDPLGKPEISLGEKIEKALGNAGFNSILCSISHSRNYVTGMTIFCK